MPEFLQEFRAGLVALLNGGHVVDEVRRYGLDALQEAALILLRENAEAPQRLQHRYGDEPVSRQNSEGDRAKTLTGFEQEPQLPHIRVQRVKPYLGQFRELGISEINSALLRAKQHAAPCLLQEFGGQNAPLLCGQQVTDRCVEMAIHIKAIGCGGHIEFNLVMQVRRLDQHRDPFLDELLTDLGGQISGEEGIQAQPDVDKGLPA